MIFSNKKKITDKQAALRAAVREDLSNWTVDRPGEGHTIRYVRRGGVAVGELRFHPRVYVKPYVSEHYDLLNVVLEEVTAEEERKLREARDRNNDKMAAAAERRIDRARSAVDDLLKRTRQPRNDI